MKVWVALFSFLFVSEAHAEDKANKFINEAAFGTIVNATCGVNTSIVTDRAYKQAVRLRGGNRVAVDQVIKVRIERALADIRMNGERQFCEAIAHLEWK